MLDSTDSHTTLVTHLLDLISISRPLGRHLRLRSPCLTICTCRQLPSYITSRRRSYLTRLLQCHHVFIFAYHTAVSSSKRNRVYNDQEVEEDQRYFKIVSSTASLLYSPCVIRTPHQRPHRVDQIDQLRLYTCIIWSSAAEGGFVLC